MVKTSPIRVHCREVCSVAPVCPPARSQARTPRGRPSPTATSAGSASGSPARRRRTGLTPGSLSPEGQPCVDGELFFSFKRLDSRPEAINRTGK